MHTRVRSQILRQKWLQAVFRTKGVYCLSSSALSGKEGQSESGKKKASLHPEWEAMAKKVLKGSDPTEKLTWKTAEVRMSEFDSLPESA